tara:strand:- start:863 stop:2119 length:1257 start_codon:yes stop_codon:yes gene_type:complete
MRSFGRFLKESKGGKNLHLEHLEDEILNGGINGARAAVNFLLSLRDMLKGESGRKMNMTVKWDGAPAVFAGTDPSDGKFFIAKKSVFNAVPLLYKSIAEIDADTKLSDTLKDKFKISFTEFSKLGIKGVLQGDLMFTNDTENKTLGGKDYVTFQPNTLIYAVERSSKLGKTISAAKIGVVWHTTYKGKDLQSMSASFGANISGMKNIPSVWMDDATYKDVSGSAKFTESETTALNGVLSSVGRKFKKIKAADLKTFLELQNKTLNKGLVGASFKTYLNTYIREGQNISTKNVKNLGYSMYVKKHFDEKVIMKLKTEKSRAAKAALRDELVEKLIKLDSVAYAIVDFMEELIAAKSLIVNKLNSIRQMTDIFVKVDNGYKVSNPEGYVAIDSTGQNAIKLVDRMEFSYNNFNAAKAWDK